jgi:hypothetical protein
LKVQTRHYRSLLSKSNPSHADVENSRFSPTIVHIFQLRMDAVERRKSAIVRYFRDGFSTLEGVVC